MSSYLFALDFKGVFSGGVKFASWGYPYSVESIRKNPTLAAKDYKKYLDTGHIPFALHSDPNHLDDPNTIHLLYPGSSAGIVQPAGLGNEEGVLDVLFPSLYADPYHDVLRHYIRLRAPTDDDRAPIKAVACYTPYSPGQDIIDTRSWEILRPDFRFTSSLQSGAYRL